MSSMIKMDDRNGWVHRRSNDKDTMEVRVIVLGTSSRQSIGYFFPPTTSNSYVVVVCVTIVPTPVPGKKNSSENLVGPILRHTV